MRVKSSTVANGTRWLALFLVLLLAVSAVPVLADSPPAEGIYQPSESELAKLPGPSDVASGISEFEKQEAAEQSKRETANAVEEREESLEAFVDISSSEARTLLLAEFAGQLAQIDQDPARMLSDASIDEILTPTTARITADGNTMLLDGTTPVRAPTEEGDLSKVSLDLVPNDDGFTPANPLAEVSLPDSASEGVEVGDDGLAVEPILTEPASAATLVGDKDVFYPETQTDTDMLAMPISSGVELFSQLRSLESPEELRFALTLPSGAELRSDGQGGAEVLREGEILARVPAPIAVDAQGADVPVSMHVEESDLVLEVAHRSMDVAYPLLVDPAILEDWATYGTTSWYSGWNFSSLTDGTWAYTSSDWGRFVPSTTPIYTNFGGSGRGLFVSAGSIGETQWAYRNGQWNYTVPGGTTYIADAGVNPLWRDNHGCAPSKYPQPHDYVGLWSPAWSSQYGWMSFQADASQSHGYAYAKPPTDWRKYTAQIFIIGLGTGAYNTAPIPCWRDLYAGGASVWMSDPENPALNGFPTASDTWIDNTAIPISVSANDPGLGVKSFRLFTTDASGAAASQIGTSISNCTGLRASPCSSSWNSSIANYNPAALPSGINTLVGFAEDALGTEHRSQGLPVYLKVDHSNPTITTSGELFTEKPKKYTLLIKANDGDAAKLMTAQSGMKSVEVFLDGSLEAREPDTASPPACSNVYNGVNVGSCNFEVDIELERALSGKHTIKIVAKDSLNHPETKTIEVNLPKDTIAPSTTLSGPLYTNAGGWLASGQASSVTVKASDTESGVTEATLYVDGVKVGKPAVQECYSGSCSLTTTLPITLTGYVEGSHAVKLITKDGAGNTTTNTWSIGVDSKSPAVASLTTTPSLPNSWNPQLKELTLNYQASDSGGGVKKVEVLLPGGVIKNVFTSACTGKAGALCPSTVKGSTTIQTSELPEGSGSLIVKAYDVFESVASGQTGAVFVDRSAPEVSATGPLISSEAGTLSGLVSEIQLTVKDKGSGVDVIDVMMDGQLKQTVALSEIEADGGSQSCKAAVCELKYNFYPELGDYYEPGSHQFSLVARDKAARSGSLVKSIQLDSQVPEVQLSGALAEAVGQEVPSGSTTLNIEAADGVGSYDSGIGTIAVKVDGQPSATLFSCKTKPCPGTTKASYPYVREAWPEGMHSVDVVVTDVAGNPASSRIVVNEPLSAVAPDCPSSNPDQEAGGKALSTVEAVGLAKAEIPGAVAPSDPAAGGGSSLNPSMATDSPGISLNEQGLDVVGTIAGGGVEAAAGGAFTVGQAVCMAPLQTTSSAQEPEIVNGDVVLFANSAPDTDTIVRPTALGMAIVQHVRGAAAPEEFSWEIGLDTGDELVTLEDGSVAVVNEDGLEIDMEGLADGQPIEIGPEELADVSVQEELGQYELEFAAREIDGEVKTVISAPEAILENGKMVRGKLVITGARVIKTVLPPGTFEAMTELVIRANPPSPPEDMCAAAFASAPNLYPVGCHPGPSDPTMDEGGTGTLADAVMGASISLRNTVNTVDSMYLLDYPGITDVINGFVETFGNMTRNEVAFCYRNGWPLCRSFYDDARLAAELEEGLFNVPAGSIDTKGNAFRHSYWTALMTRTAGSSLGYIFAKAHEGGAWQSANRRVVDRKSSRMDILNDLVGYLPGQYTSDLAACQQMIDKIPNSNYVHPDTDPYKWSETSGYEFFRQVFRKKKDLGKDRTGLVVLRNGQSCSEAW